MPRKNLIRSKTHPYHVWNRVNNREWFPLAIKDVWEIFCEELYISVHLHGLRVHAFVLMDNHFHLLASTPESDLGTVMRDFQSSINRKINLASGRTGRIFAGRYRRTIITDARYYSHLIKYIYRNPVKAGIVERVEDYPFSTLSGLIGLTPLLVPVSHPLEGAGDSLLWEDPYSLLEWLNEPLPAELEKSIRSANRKSVFELPKTSTWQRRRFSISGL